MNTPKDELLIEQLKALAAKGWACVNGGGNGSEYIHYSTSLRYELWEYYASDCLEAKKELAKAYLPYMHSVITQSNVPSAHIEEISSFMGVVLGNNLVRYMLTESGYADLFAGTILIAAALGKDKESSLFKHAQGLAQALEMQHHLDDRTVTLEAMTLRLYGPGAWLLFSGEVEKPELLAKYLVLNHIPLLRSIKGAVQSCEKPLCTPTDF